MRVCAGCEYEYPEDLNFCGQCGRAWGGQAAADESDKLNQHLREMAASASAELRMERTRDYRPNFSSESALSAMERI